MNEYKDDQDDSENEIDFINGDIFNYKGYFAQDKENEDDDEEEETKIFEFGAHFPYRFLYKKLETLAKELNEEKISDSSVVIHQSSQSQEYDQKDKMLNYLDQKEYTRNIDENIHPNYHSNPLQAPNKSSISQENKKNNDTTESKKQMSTSYVTKLKINRRLDENNKKAEKIHQFITKSSGKKSQSQKKSISKNSQTTIKKAKQRNKVGVNIQILSDISTHSKTKALSSSYHQISKCQITQSLKNIYKYNKNKRNHVNSSGFHPQTTKLVTRNKSNKNNRQANRQIKSKFNQVRLVINDIDFKKSKLKGKNHSNSDKHSHKLSNDSVPFHNNIKNESIKGESGLLIKQALSTTNDVKNLNYPKNNEKEKLSLIGLSNEYISRNAKKNIRTQSSNLSQTKSNLVTERENSSHQTLNKTYGFPHKATQHKQINNLTKTVFNKTQSRNNQSKIDNHNYIKFKTYLDLKLNLIQKNNEEMINNAKKRIRLSSLGDNAKDTAENKISHSIHKTINYSNKINTINNSTNASSGCNLRQKDLLNYNNKNGVSKSVTTNKKIEYTNKKIIQSYTQIPNIISEKNINKKETLNVEEIISNGQDVREKHKFNISNNYILQFKKPVIQTKGVSKKIKMNLFNNQVSSKTLANQRNSKKSIKSKQSETEM